MTEYVSPRSAEFAAEYSPPADDPNFLEALAKALLATGKSKPTNNLSAAGGGGLMGRSAIAAQSGGSGGSDAPAPGGEEAPFATYDEYVEDYRARAAALASGSQGGGLMGRSAIAAQLGGPELSYDEYKARFQRGGGASPSRLPNAGGHGQGSASGSWGPSVSMAPGVADLQAASSGPKGGSPFAANDIVGLTQRPEPRTIEEVVARQIQQEQVKAQLASQLMDPAGRTPRTPRTPRRPGEEEEQDPYESGGIGDSLVGKTL